MKAENNNKENAYGILSAVMLIVIGILIGTLMSISRMSRRIESDPSLGKIEQVVRYINHYYVDSLERDSITDIMIASTLSALDPHSTYFTEKEARAAEEKMSGYFGGVGIALQMIDDTVRVSEVFADGPAQMAGLHPGDKIVEADGIKLSGVKMALDEAITYLRGKPRTMVDIGVLRYGEKGLRHIKVQRNQVSQPSVTLSTMIDREVGYVAISLFNQNTYQEFCKAVAALKTQGLKDLIIDLRDNGGGQLSAAVQIADELLPGREMIVYVEGDHDARTEYRSSNGGLFTEGRLAILINEHSASASEVLSGAIQDNDRGIIVGRRSFGKGLVQNEYRLKDRSMMLLTTGHYYTPSGRCIQRPYDKGTDAYYTSFLTRMALEYAADTVLMTINDSTPYYTKKGRVVYGGGGIYPDHVIRFNYDPSYTAAYSLVSDKDHMKLMLQYVASHYSSLIKQYPTQESFVRRYSVSDELVAQTMALAAKKNLNTKDIAKNKEFIKLYMKGRIGGHIYSGDTFSRITLLGWNDELENAISLLKKQPRN